MSSSPTPNHSAGRSQKLDGYARSFTRGFERVVDAILSPFSPTPVQPEELPDWDPDMPVRPDDPSVDMQLIGTRIVLLDADQLRKAITLSATPDSGHIADDPLDPGESLTLTMRLRPDAPDEAFQGYYQRLNAWALSETPLLIFGTPDSHTWIVNPVAPDEWLPLPLVDENEDAAKQDGFEGYDG